MSPRTMGAGGEVYHPPGRVECRVYERLPSGVATACQPVAARGADDLKWKATIRDVSLGGIGLVVSRRFERGVALAIELPDAKGTSFYTTFARVVHNRPLPGGLWLHGCALVGQLTEEGLAALLRTGSEPAAAAGPPESAADEGEPAENILLHGVHLRCWFRGRQEVRCFVKGLRVAGPWPLERGTIIRGFLGRGTQDKVPVCMRVSGCYRKGDSWTLVCKVEDATPAAITRLGTGKKPQ